MTGIPEMSRLTGTSRRHRGFTLAEVLVVAVVMMLLAGLIVPRITGLQGRRNELALEQITDLMTMFAYKESIGDQQVGIWMDPQRDAISLMILDVDPEAPSEPAFWRRDVLVPEVRLPEGVRIAEVLENQLRMNTDGEWFIKSVPGEDRPMIQVRLEAPGMDTTLTLLPHSHSPYRSEDSGESEGFREAFDLDDAGRTRDVW